MLNLVNESNSREASAVACGVELLEITPLIMRRIREEMRRRSMPGLTLPQFRALNYIRHRPCASLNDLAEHMGLTAATASKIVQKLVLQNVVERKDAADRRRISLSLTDLGAGVLEKAHAETLQHLAGNLKRLSQSELDTVAKGLQILDTVFSQGGNNVNLS
jgi:DNA-binding MarR family transcriptional regulator